ncbi:Flagellar hook-associated protein FlgK [Anaerovibrio sp. JC8]|uniref:flagellar hook-associated protein FlgK n=1 Tax=Anaerovibrio sp. JC8 TaxID=1240085 RepID=UPI000A0DD6D2|nr:flagellar hook-associated protein FlgK [Anaerovibrio sp. JC8]ORU00595.1 Flagellar hook-associated protein FlgK [Anaerovibrio sp. JC8]
MLSTFHGLNTMVSGIQNNRVGLNTVGHNISNSSTEGYSRQQVNSVATRSQTIWSYSRANQIGSGVGVYGINRARDIYADRQYWKENTNDGYYNAKAKNYSKLETIFNDSDDNALQDSMEKFYQAWVDCSTTASTASSRQNVINAGYNFAETLNATATQVQSQIESVYGEILLSVDNVNSILDRVTVLNGQILEQEADGSSSNDLRDQRDLLVDQLSRIMHISVNETPNGMYNLVCNGTTLVNGTSKVTIAASAPLNNKVYGVSDYTLLIKESDIQFNPGNGELYGQIQAVYEDKEYIDRLANMAGFLLSTLNAQHKAGYTLEETSGQIKKGGNFYGQTGVEYTWVTDSTTGDAYLTKDTEQLRGIQIIKELTINQDLTATDGHKLLAARSGATTDTTGDDPAHGAASSPASEVNGVADGSNAVWISTLFNCVLKNTGAAAQNYGLSPAGGKRAIGDESFYSYYNTSMTTLGGATENMNNKVEFQSDLMTQIENLRESTSGVNWDEELTNMITYQQGYAACSRCLTTMDEMLDRLINSTGVVGR